MENKYSRHKEKGLIKQYVPLIIILLVATFLVMFAVQNSHAVDIKLLFRTFNISLSLALLISVFIGVILTLIYSIGFILEKNKTIKNLKAQLKELKNTLEQYDSSMEENSQEHPKY